MTEARLLFDETAIRLAAGNPNGKNLLNIPDLSTIEQIPDPKELLFDLLREASGLTGRRLKRFNMAESRIRITELISDFSPLRQLSAFQGLEKDISTLKQNGWVPAIDSEIEQISSASVLVPAMNGSQNKETIR
jgi:hypothetical protein